VITFRNPVSTPLTTDMYIEFANYESAVTTDKQRLIYAYMTNGATFSDGEPFYSMI